MAFAITATKGTSNTGALALGTVTAGDLLFFGGINTTSSAVTITSVADGLGTSWNSTRVPDASGGNTLIAAWGFAGGSGTCTVTVTWSAGTTGRSAWAGFNGTSTVGATQDGSVVSAFVSGTTMTTPAIPATGADNLIINYVDENNGTCTFGSPWTTASTLSFVGGIGYQLDVAAGTYNPNLTFGTTGANRSIGLAIKAAAGGSSFIPHRMPLGV